MTKLSLDIKQNKVLMRLISPIVNTRRYFTRKNINIQAKVYENLCDILISDPIIHIDEFNGDFLIDKRSTLFRRLILNGHYEPLLVKHCCEYLDSDRDVIDVGANIGFYSVLFGKNLSLKNRVLSIEPTKNAFEKLVYNLQLNEIESKVILYNGVASNAVGKIKINTIAGKEEYSSLGVMTHPSISMDTYTSYSVESSTIDSLVKTYSLNPGFIKIDVEGAENLVLEGCQQVLKENRPVILMEVSDALLQQNGSSAKSVINTLYSYGYDIIDPASFKKYSAIQAYGDILCIPK